MPNVYDHYDGICTICGEETEVRHKNIWLIGSEGIDMCMPCERDMLHYLSAKRSKFIHEKLEKKKAEIRKAIFGV